MSMHRVSTPLALSGTSSRYQYEPKGTCLIISPWNFPVNLTFGPLVSAIAAGNTAILKPSEITPHTSTIMAKIVKELFPEDEVCMVEGGIEVSRELLKLPFNHIFFTGSPGVGKVVMKAAAENLSTVTLELGGKSPVIVDETANLKSAAKKIAWGKFLNSGQICISPDYLLVKESVKDALIEAIMNQVQNFYSANPSESNSYSRIVNKSHYLRLVGHLEDAKSKGATLAIGGDYEAESCYIAPTLLNNLPDTATLMQEEIFGPLLPVISYKSTDEAISYINAREKPLALYIYSRDSHTTEHILKQTRAGSTCINTNLLQYSNLHLPFGGVNNSGMGKSHGYYGFREFSNQRSVLEQHFPTAMELLFPP
jgi:aldehyde dehydrogenase (NAD+)